MVEQDFCRSFLNKFSYQKDDEPLLNLTGAMSRWSRAKGAYVYTNEGTRVPSLNTGGFVCTR